MLNLIMFVVDEYLAKDVREFFSPLLDYAVTSYIQGSEKMISDIGYSYAFYANMETKPVAELDGEVKKFVDDLGLGEVDSFPLGAYNLLKQKKKTILIGYGLDDVLRLAEGLELEGEYIRLHKLVSRTDAGDVPVVHSHLLLFGSPHPLVDDVVYKKISGFGFKPMIDDVDRSLLDYEVRFKRVFSSWSMFVKDIKAMADMVESKLDSEKGAREIYALSHLLDGELDMGVLWDRVGRVMELPSTPNLDVLIVHP